MKKSVAMGLIVLGLLAGVSGYLIRSEVDEGKLKVARAEDSLSKGKSLFSLNPISKQIGKRVSSEAKQKIGEANQEISYYESLYRWLFGLGGASVVIGFFLLFRRAKRWK